LTNYDNFCLISTNELHINLPKPINVVEFYFVYITVATSHQAKTIGRTLLEERLAACINILPPIESMYRWEGEIQSDTETVMIAKTTISQFEQLKKRVLELHTYDCPCIVALPVEDGHDGYLQWLRQQLHQ
jgi:periplasmic divalent cation tolerance protein